MKDERPKDDRHSVRPLRRRAQRQLTVRDVEYIAFQNGNKRIAMTTLFVFLHRNEKWLRVDTQELYNFTIWVAQSPRTVKDETVKATEKFLQSHLVKLET